MDNIFGYNQGFSIASPTATGTSSSNTNGVSYADINGRATTSINQDISITGNATIKSVFVQFVYTTATLPSNPSVGTSVLVSDASNPTYQSILASGGATLTRVTYDGSHWRNF